MAIEEVDVEVRDDFLKRQTAASPIQAVAELIWNALDEDATDVRVEINYTGAQTMREIVVSDNGNGIPRAEARDLFKGLGGSWKKLTAHTKRLKRELHGKEGRGRFKAFALGRTVDWKTVYLKGKVPHTYTVTIIEDAIRKVRITDEKPLKGGTPGTTVVVSDLKRTFASLEDDSAPQELTEIFAIYLRHYRDVSIQHCGTPLDSAGAIADEWPIKLGAIVDEGGKSHPLSLTVIEWKRKTKRTLYLCNEQGFPLTQVEGRFQTGDFDFSAYLRSGLFQVLQDENRLDLADMSKPVTDALERARASIKDLARRRGAERAKTYVAQWKSEEIYPFTGEPQNDLERAERQIFDMVAVTVHAASPTLEKAPPQQLALHLEMLKVAIEHSPSDLQRILSEVVKLPKRKVKELAELLQDTDLAGIINAAKVVTDRLRFLEALEVILFNFAVRKKVKERTQLHKLLENNSWIFGEEFNLWVSDKGLTTALRAYADKLKADVVIDEPVKPAYRQKGIVDLVMSRHHRLHRAEEFENLVVEIKAPKVKLKGEHLAQIEDYAFAVASDARFHAVKGVRWYFWLVSDEYDDFIASKLKGGADPTRRIIHKDDRVSIGVKTWGEIISENQARLQFIKEKLEHRPDEARSLELLQEKYRDFLEGISDDEAEAADTSESEDAT